MEKAGGQLMPNNDFDGELFRACEAELRRKWQKRHDAGLCESLYLYCGDPDDLDLCGNKANEETVYQFRNGYSCTGPIPPEAQAQVSFTSRYCPENFADWLEAHEEFIRRLGER